MGDDLGGAGHEVHAQAQQVLHFWFQELKPEQWFRGGDAVDAALRERFASLRDAVLETRAAGWLADAQTLLAAVILLDQFSRNIYRGSAEAFAADPLARELTLHALDQGWHEGLSADERMFLYLPLQHAEDRELQSLSLSLYEGLGKPETLDFARQHADVIARFGRFPGRNAALGRQNTAEEAAWLSQPGVAW